MRLSLVMFFGKKPYGYKYRGKHRVIKEIRPHELKQLRLDYERTEKNMLFLRYPYLTIEQSHGHMSHLKEQKFVDMLEKQRKYKDDKFAKHMTIAEQLAHLKVKDAWD